MQRRCQKYGDWALSGLKRSCPLLLLLLSFACAPDRGASVQPGLTTAEEIVGSRGKPDHEVKPSSRPTATLLGYSTGHLYQIEGGTVVVSNRPPEDHERTLQYWRHQWRGLRTEEKDVPGTRGPHGITERELRVIGQGKAVVFDVRSGEVVRVAVSAPVRRGGAAR